MDPKDPFKAIFEVSNDGGLWSSLSDVNCDCLVQRVEFSSNTIVSRYRIEPSETIRELQAQHQGSVICDFTEHVNFSDSVIKKGFFQFLISYKIWPIPIYRSRKTFGFETVQDSNRVLSWKPASHQYSRLCTGGPGASAVSKEY